MTRNLFLIFIFLLHSSTSFLPYLHPPAIPPHHSSLILLSKSSPKSSQSPKSQSVPSPKSKPSKSPKTRLEGGAWRKQKTVPPLVSPSDLTNSTSKYTTTSSPSPPKYNGPPPSTHFTTLSPPPRFKSPPLPAPPPRRSSRPPANKNRPRRNPDLIVNGLPILADPPLRQIR